MQHTLFIGGGNMALAILSACISRGANPEKLHVVDPDPLALEKVQVLGIACSPNWPLHFDPIQVVLAVKPQAMQHVVQNHAHRLQGRLLISIAAGVSTQQLQNWSQQPGGRVARCMPNTPARVFEGLTGLFFTLSCTLQDQQNVAALFENCGKTITVQTEEQINAITAISGSGPGYVFFLMEALEHAAHTLGFDTTQARLLVAQTFLGASTLASQTEQSFASLREQVTSKGGTTFAGLEVLRDKHVQQAVFEAAQAAMQRAQTLEKN